MATLKKNFKATLEMTLQPVTTI